VLGWQSQAGQCSNRMVCIAHCAAGVFVFGCPWNRLCAWMGSRQGDPSWRPPVCIISQRRVGGWGHWCTSGPVRAVGGQWRVTHQEEGAAERPMHSSCIAAALGQVCWWRGRVLVVVVPCAVGDHCLQAVQPASTPGAQGQGRAAAAAGHCPEHASATGTQREHPAAAGAHRGTTAGCLCCLGRCQVWVAWR
jgi:hypothetical protein